MAKRSLSFCRADFERGLMLFMRFFFCVMRSSILVSINVAVMFVTVSDRLIFLLSDVYKCCAGRDVCFVAYDFWGAYGGYVINSLWDNWKIYSYWDNVWE